MLLAINFGKEKVSNRKRFSNLGKDNQRELRILFWAQHVPMISNQQFAIVNAGDDGWKRVSNAQTLRHSHHTSNFGGIIGTFRRGDRRRWSRIRRGLTAANRRNQGVRRGPIGVLGLLTDAFVGGGGNDTVVRGRSQIGKHLW